RRVSLPTYPFAREKYWVETVGQVVASAIPNQQVPEQTTRPTTTRQVLHPLLHTNTSDLEGQRYTSTFSGEESFLLDPHGNGQKGLPDLGYLEMARVAVAQATGTQRDPGVLELRNVVWGQPLLVTPAKQLTFALFAADSGEIDYEVYSSENGEETV